jgi:large subunit ribosomal protein L3
VPRVFHRGAAQLVANSVVNTYPSTEPELYEGPEGRHKRRQLKERPGLVGIKRRMVTWYDNDGNAMPATVLEIDRVQITDVKWKEKHGYYAVQLGCGAKKHTNVTRQMLGHYSRAQVAPKADLWEFQVKDAKGLAPLGTPLFADHFVVGQFVDLKSKTKGKGFQGVIKRYGFSTQPSTHGNSKTTRHAGSTGQNQDPGRVFPGKKMAGHMGFEYRTVQNAEVLHVDKNKGILVVKGHVCGSDGRSVKITDATKKPLHESIVWPPAHAEDVDPIQSAKSSGHKPSF